MSDEERRKLVATGFSAEEADTVVDAADESDLDREVILSLVSDAASCAVIAANYARCRSYVPSFEVVRRTSNCFFWRAKIRDRYVGASIALSPGTEVRDLESLLLHARQTLRGLTRG